MSWRDRFRTASFRGVQFSIEAADTAGGRRVVTHEYPLRNRPYSEDLGRSARQFTVDGFIVGENYDRQRDALVAACEADGPGELIHPYKGTLQVLCTGITEREQITEQRVVRVSMTFVERGGAGRPSETPDPRARLDSAAQAATDASESVLETGFSLTGMPEFVRKDALGTLQDGAQTVRTALDRVGQVSSEAVSAIDFVADNAGTLVDAPADMASAITRMVNDVTGSLSDAGDALDLAESLRSIGDDNDDIPGDTPTRDRQRDNRSAQQRHMRIAGIAAASRAAGRTEWPSRRRAETRRARLLAWIEEEQFETDDTALYDALQEDRARVALAVPPKNERPPNVRTTTLDATLPALVVAYGLYGDATRAEEIARRNELRHPGFVPGGVELEYLSRE